MGGRHGRGQPDDHALEHALEARRPRHGRRERADRLDIPRRRPGEAAAGERDGLRPPDAAPVPRPRRGAVRDPRARRRRGAEPRLEGHGARPHRRDRRHPARRHEPRPLDGSLPHRRASRERDDVQLQRSASGVSAATVAQRLRPGLRPAIVWGVLVGVAQAATPLPFWWLNAATVYALGLAAIAFIYIGFAVADGRWIVIAVESGVATLFVIIAAAAITATPWLLVIGLAGHGFKDLWQHRTHFVATTRWWPPFCLAVDWAVAAIIAVEIIAGVDFQH